MTRSSFNPDETGWDWDFGNLPVMMICSSKVWREQNIFPAVQSALKLYQYLARKNISIFQFFVST
jgi:hypothetical protein